jgi:type IV secretion system protein VirB6
MTDETALGWARTIYLSSVIGSLAILRVAGGLLLGLAPLIAGLLLFDFARGLFAGWLRGLVLVALSSLGMTLLLAVEVAVMEPWLADALQRRSLGYATPSAPTELMALALAFAVASVGILVLLGKVAFQNAWSFKIERQSREARDRPSAPMPDRNARAIEVTAHARALTVSEGVLNLIRHEEGRRGIPQFALAAPAQIAAHHASTADSNARIGSSWRRSSQRTTAAQTQRDQRP